MPIETIDDIIEGLADKLGVYGAHDDECTAKKPCRVCWTSDFRDHLMGAFQVERILYPLAGAPAEKTATPEEK